MGVVEDNSRPYFVTSTLAKGPGPDPVIRF